MKKNIRIRDYIPALIALMLFIFSSCDTEIDTGLETAIDRGNVFSSQDGIYTAPVADAGHDMSMNVGQTIILDGSESSDADGDELTYEWRIIERPEGSIATLDDETLIDPSFTANTSGRYEIELTVDDGTEISTDSMIVTVDSDAPDRSEQSDDDDHTCFIRVLFK